MAKKPTVNNADSKAEIIKTPVDMTVITEDKSAVAIGNDDPNVLMAELEALAKQPAHAVLEDVTAGMQPDNSKPVDDGELAKHGVKYLGENDEFILVGSNVFFADSAKRLEQAQIMQSRRGQNNLAGPRTAAPAPLGVFLPKTKSFRGVPYRSNTGSILVNW